MGSERIVRRRKKYEEEGDGSTGDFQQPRSQTVKFL